MNILPNVFRNRRLQCVVATTVLLISGTFIVAGAAFMKVMTAPAELRPAEEKTLPGPHATDDAVKPPAHVLALTPNGFEPMEVSWPRGRFFLAIDNHTGVNGITLLLDREVGSRVKEINLKTRKQRGVGIFDLPPGNYRLTEANHSGWVCRITITPQ